MIRKEEDPKKAWKKYPTMEDGMTTLDFTHSAQTVFSFSVEKAMSTAVTDQRFWQGYKITEEWVF